MRKAIARIARAAAGQPALAPNTNAAAAADPLRAVVIDLDQLGIPRRGYAHDALRTLLAACGPHSVALASGRDCTFVAYRDACRELGVRAFQAPSVRDGADRALLASAAALADLGVVEFVVVSGDHAFAHLPGTVRVVMPAGREIARVLSARAAAVVSVTMPAPPQQPARRRRSSASSRARAVAAAA